MHTLTSRERVTRMMERRDHDRIPRHESFWPETLLRWQEEGLEGDVLQLLESDFHSLGWCWPQAFPGQEQILSEDTDTKVVRDGQGKRVRYWKNKSRTPEHLGFECGSPEAWKSIFKPALLANSLQIDPGEITKSFEQGGAATGTLADSATLHRPKCRFAGASHFYRRNVARAGAFFPPSLGRFFHIAGKDRALDR